MLKIRMLDYIGDTGRQQLEQPVYCEPESRRPTTVEDDKQNVSGANPEKVKSTTQDLFELLERVQSSRLDDQRCVLPSYFSQVCDGIRIYSRIARMPSQYYYGKKERVAGRRKRERRKKKENFL